MRKTAITILFAATMAMPAYSAQIFKDVTDEAGINSPGNGKGIAFADVNGDGNWDLYISNKGGAGKLYINDGKGKFADMTEKSGEGIADTGFKMGSVFFDYDNDGMPDLYLAKGGRYEIESNRLLKNMGDGKFVDVTDKAGVGFKGFTYAAAAADFNNDGYLDIYLANSGVGKKNILYKNNGDGTFSDVTDVAGVGDRSWSWMATWADVNGDGWQDLYVVNGRYPSGEPNKLYINNANGTFREESVARGVEDANWGLGATFADIDNDGDLDLFVSNYIGPNGLYVNDGKGYFANKTKESGIVEPGWGKGPTFGDIDNDGYVDLYEGDCKGANKLYHNNGNGTFTNISAENSNALCSFKAVRTKGTMFADIDNDGHLDLFVVNWAAPSKLFKNTLADKNWLKVRLKGSVSNAMAVGSRVWVRDGEKMVGMRDMITSSGFCSQAPQELHYGLQYGKTYTVEVRFPSGIRKIVEGVKAGQTITIEEPGKVAQK